MIKDATDYISFINISSDELNLFEWKPPSSFKSYILDLNIVKENKANDIYFHLNKGNLKIVYIRKNSLIYSIGARDLQYQILEALLEKIFELFHEIYDVSVILSFDNTTTAIFKPFKGEVDDLLNNIHDYDLVKKVDVYCSVCKATLPLYVKKTIIKNATSFPIPLVYTHKGHSIITYIDKDFVVRGQEYVNVTG